MEAPLRSRIDKLLGPPVEKLVPWYCGLVLVGGFGFMAYYTFVWKADATVVWPYAAFIVAGVATFVALGQWDRASRVEKEQAQTERARIEREERMIGLLGSIDARLERIERQSRRL